jgi:hypothetical protein
MLRRHAQAGSPVSWGFVRLAKNTDTCVPRRSQRSRLPNAHVELRVTQQKPLRVAWTEQISKSRSGNFVMLDRLRARQKACITESR